MSFKHEESDGLIPNKQTPPATKQLGTTSDMWDEVHATTITGVTTLTGTTVSGTTIGAGTALYLQGDAVPRRVQMSDNIEAAGKKFTHNLGAQYVQFQVYDSNASGIPFGSGDAGFASGLFINGFYASGTNDAYIYPSAAVSGATVLFIG